MSFASQNEFSIARNIIEWFMNKVLPVHLAGLFFSFLFIEKMELLNHFKSSAAH